MPRQARTERRAGMRVVLSVRDEALLRALARFRLARTSDLHRLLFPGIRRDTAIARLRRLVAGEFLTVRVTHEAQENLYALGPRGRAWLGGQGTATGRAPKGDVSHHLAIVALWTELAIAAHRLEGVELIRAQADWEIRHGSPHWPLAGAVPDLWVESAVTGRLGASFGARFAIEVDLGTERAAVLRRKLVVYRQCLVGTAAQGDAMPFGLVVAVQGWSEKRRQSFGEFLDQTWPSWWIVWDLVEGAAALLARVVTEATTPLTASPGVRGGGDLQAVERATETDAGRRSFS